MPRQRAPLITAVDCQRIVQGLPPRLLTRLELEAIAERLAAPGAEGAAAAGPRPHANGATCLGVHLEGPYLSPRFPGAQLSDAIRPPNLAEFAELVAAGPVRMITLAPEQPGGHDLVRAAVQRGIVAVAGGLTCAELGAMYPSSGGWYVFLREAYGPVWGFLFGCFYPPIHSIQDALTLRTARRPAGDLSR